MDFARIIDDKKSEKIDWENYPIKVGKWYETRGLQEQNTTKKSDIFPIPDAKIIAVLHENHKTYFSSESQKYLPFILEPSLDRNTREFVKNFFMEKYKLSVSVRPIHKKFYKNDIPFVMVNVQIQTGKHNFSEFSKSDAKIILENLSN